MNDLRNYPFRYRAFGLHVASEFEVTALEPANSDVADVFIRFGSVPPALHPAKTTTPLFDASDESFLLRMEGLARYLIIRGREIIVEPLAENPLHEISAFITGISFGALLLQRRLLPLHASSVLFNDVCYLFTGASGAGKSTLAAAMIRQGARLLADDIAVLDFEGSHPAVRPSFPTLRMWEDSLTHLGFSTESLLQVRGELRKFYLPAPAFENRSHPISRIVVLGTHNRNEVLFRPVHGVEKFRLLKKHTYLFRGIPNTGLEENHFILANRLASAVPVFLLIRPTRWIHTDQLTDKFLIPA